MLRTKKSSSKRNGSLKKLSIPPKADSKLPDVPFVQILFLDRLMLGLAIPIVANWIIPDHDADAFKPPTFRFTNPQKEIWMDKIVERIFGGFKRWDSLHFLHIAEYGYTFENNLAFFPLYPILIRLITELWFPFVPALSFSSALLVTGSLINVFAFLAAGYFLFILTRRVVKNSTTAFICVVIFAINPASVFFSACYTESLFSLLTWGGLASLYRNPKEPYAGVLEASIFFGLALVTRSNGLLNFGFIGFVLLAKVIDQCKERNVIGILTTVAIGLLALMVMFAPFLYHQYHVWNVFCHRSRPSTVMLKFSRENDYVLPGELNKLPWCNQSIPISYQSVQNRYWNVGFLGYYKLKKIPCFILAAPAIIITYFAIFHSLKGLKPSEKKFVNIFEDAESLLPFILHSLALAVVGVFFMNVEVFTRFIFSASPLPYWYLARCLKRGLEQKPDGQNCLKIKDSDLYSSIRFLWKCSSSQGKLIIGYCIAYAVIGALLHCNFYPWT